MNRRLTIELALAILMVAALIVLDTIFDYGLLRVLQWRPGWLAMLIAGGFIGGLWLLLTCDPHYRFLHGDRVDAGPIYGRGTVVHCDMVDRAAVYEVDLDSGGSIALADDELNAVAKIAPGRPERRRPWYRPELLP